MKKNVAGQVIAAHLKNRADGTPFTGTATVFIVGDNGSRTAGTQNSGNATHKGNGTHVYVPSQAETNFDHVAFEFSHADAIAVVAQVYTTFPQTGDSFARLGAPNGGVSLADDLHTMISIIADTVDKYTFNSAIALLATQASVDDLPTNAEFAARTLLAAEYATASAVGDVPTNAEFNARTIAAASYATAADIVTIANLISALNNLSSSDVQAAVAAALAVTRAEPGQASPGATISPLLKLDFLYQWARNKSEVTSTEIKRYADNGTTVAQKASHATDAGTYTRQEMTTGA